MNCENARVSIGRKCDDSDYGYYQEYNGGRGALLLWVCDYRESVTRSRLSVMGRLDEEGH
jgi:hypothetical protein